MNAMDVFPEDLIAAIAAKLKDKASYPGVEPPTESVFWKTASIREFAPTDTNNFWYIRAASMLRKLYKGGTGVNRLKKQYGGRTGSVMHAEHSKPGSGAIIRRIFQQLESANLVKKTEKRGRELTNAGRSLLDKTAAEIKKNERISA
jgi:small subunit ribosomal protein S19e